MGLPKEEDKAFVRRLKKQSTKNARVRYGKIFGVALLLAPLIWLEHYLVGQGTYFTGILLTVYICSHVFDVKAQNARDDLLDRAKIERALTSYKTPNESTLWLGAFMDSFWEDLIEEKIATIVYDAISGIIAEKKPAFVSKMEIESCGFGSNPPNVNNFVVQGTDDPDLKVMEFDVDFNGKDFRLIIKAIGADEYMLLKGRHFSVKLTALGFKFRARLYIHKGTNMLFITAVNRPKFYLFDSHMAGISPKAIPFFNVKDFLESSFEKAIVEPKRVVLLMEEIILGRLPAEPHGGKLKLQVRSCESIPVSDAKYLMMPQIVVSTDLNTFRSKVLKGSDPDVDESYDIEVNGAKGCVELLVIDVNNDNARIGTSRFDFAIARGNCTTIWTENVAGLPMCKKLEEEEEEGWEADLPIKGTNGMMKVVISSVKWEFDEGAAASLSPTRKEPSTIVLFIIKARHLEGKDRGGTSDPYALVKYGKSYSKKTSVITKTTSPIWAETFVFERRHGRHGDIIDVEIFDKDKVKSESLGKCKISLKGLKYGHNRKEWKHLRNCSSGQIFYSVTHKKGTPFNISHKDLFADAGLTNTLVVSVVEAKNLIKADKDGDSDPYVSLEYGQTKKKSEVFSDNLNPQFNFFALFPYSADEKTLNLVLKDYNRVGKAKPLGSVKIDVQTLGERESVEDWFPLKGVPTGQVLVQVYRTKAGEENDGDEGGIRLTPDEGDNFSRKRKSSIFSFKVKNPRKLSVIE
ncbi:C2 domain-containing protein [Chloropicon primus]|uniref:C2 domain-containing protein n=1 Tax=Chloropicon primus TaxID=1764295 RepID=A0A5B8MDE7_9CHLO|nr:hypothetical protein A3770_01p07790 [Chloropicon primus]UPQ97472.1 C2 domain-containing protein [Chloropicon primus]|eukprot:QDZ18261.1 hypothetical protein A3770_01p07790 [Chloropicon primus]